jgi:hypothetical protein
MVKRDYAKRFLNIEETNFGRKVESKITNEEVRITKSPDEEGNEAFKVSAVDKSKDAFSDERGEQLGFAAFPDEDYFEARESAEKEATEMGVGFFADSFFNTDISPTTPTSGGVQREVENTEAGDIPVSVAAGRGLQEFHQNRSERARDVDNQRRAEITTNEEKWLENPDRFDFPGIDTPTANDNQYGADDVLTVDESEEKSQPVPWFLR